MTSPEAAALTLDQQAAQRTIRNGILRDTAALWALLNVADPEPWLAASTRQVQLAHARSGRSAAAYLDQFRTVEVGTSRQITLAPFDPAATSVALHINGPTALHRALERGVSSTEATRIALTLTAGTMVKHALDGGRGTLIDAIREDRQATGWIRQTGPSPCSFCAMLAGRGPVYRSASSAIRTGYTHGARRGWQLRGTRARDESFHDHCMCTAEPIYLTDGPWQEEFSQHAEWRELWDSSTRGARTPREARNAFRRAYEGRA